MTTLKNHPLKQGNKWEKYHQASGHKYGQQT